MSQQRSRVALLLHSFSSFFSSHFLNEIAKVLSVSGLAPVRIIFFNRYFIMDLQIATIEARLRAIP